MISVKVRFPYARTRKKFSHLNRFFMGQRSSNIFGSNNLHIPPNYLLITILLARGEYTNPGLWIGLFKTRPSTDNGPSFKKSI